MQLFHSKMMWATKVWDHTKKHFSPLNLKKYVQCDILIPIKLVILAMFHSHIFNRSSSCQKSLKQKSNIPVLQYLSIQLFTLIVTLIILYCIKVVKWVFSSGLRLFVPALYYYFIFTLILLMCFIAFWIFSVFYELSLLCINNDTNTNEFALTCSLMK